MLMLNLLLGADFPGFAFLVSPVLTALLLGAGELAAAISRATCAGAPARAAT